MHFISKVNCILFVNQLGLKPQGSLYQIQSRRKLKKKRTFIPLLYASPNEHIYPDVIGLLLAYYVSTGTDFMGLF